MTDVQSPRPMYVLLAWDAAEEACWHTLDSRGTRAGEPDLRMTRPPRYILAELKSQHGRLSIEQSAALALLERCPGIEAYHWKPSDWQTIVRVLR